MNQRQRAIAEDLAGQDVILAASRAEFAKRIAKARRTEAEILEGIESGRARGGMPILFTAYRTMSSLFESATVIEDLSTYKSTDVHTWNVDELLPHGRVRKGTGRATLSSFCSVGNTVNYLSLDVRPRKAVIDKIAETMLLADGYTINFEVIVRGDSALVTAHYNQITGSRWLALIHSDSVLGVGR